MWIIVINVIVLCVSSMLPCSTQLQFYSRNIGDTGGEELAKALTANRSLTRVCSLAWYGCLLQDVRVA